MSQRLMMSNRYEVPASQEFPTKIPVYQHRIDITTNLPVSRGNILKFLSATEPTYTLDEFYKLLQCPAHEPDMEYFSGSISLLKMVPPTRETVELMCGYSESRETDW